MTCVKCLWSNLKGRRSYDMCQWFENTMDDSILNNWITESDIPSEENVSHIGRDYTPEFTTDQTNIFYFFCHHTIIESRSNNVVLMHICYLLTDF